MPNETEIDRAFLKALTETPSVGTACGPVVALLHRYFGETFSRTVVSDGFALYQPENAGPEKLRTVLVAHMDEIGGVAYGERGDGSFAARFWGTSDPALYVNAELQAWDYLSSDAASAFPVTAEVYTEPGNDQPRLALRGDGIRPYRTAFTFRQETTFDEGVGNDTEGNEGDGEGSGGEPGVGPTVNGKAVDPRATLYAVCEAVRRLGDPTVGALIVMAEECAMDIAQKAVVYLQRYAPDLTLVVNADVPSLANLGDARLDLPAIRVFEGHHFIDPAFGIRMAQTLIDQNVALHLSAARSGSQTRLFSPLAPTISVALPGQNIHTPRGTMSLLGISRCVDLLMRLGEWTPGSWLDA